MSERDKELRRRRKRRDKRLKARIREAVKAGSRRTASPPPESQSVVEEEIKPKARVTTKSRTKTAKTERQKKG